MNLHKRLTSSTFQVAITYLTDYTFNLITHSLPGYPNFICFFFFTEIEEKTLYRIIRYAYDLLWRNFFRIWATYCWQITYLSTCRYIYVCYGTIPLRIWSRCFNNFIQTYSSNLKITEMFKMARFEIRSREWYFNRRRWVIDGEKRKFEIVDFTATFVKSVRNFYRFNQYSTYRKYIHVAVCTCTVPLNCSVRTSPLFFCILGQK